MSISMYLKSGSDKINIPVLPESITIQDNANNASVTVVDAGELSILKGRKLRQYSFSSFFPATAFRGIKKENLKTPSHYVNQIEEWMNEKAVVEFVFARDEKGFVSWDKKCTIESFKYNEDGADVGTIHYSIQLKEYKKVTVNQIKKSSKSKKASKNSSKKRTSTKKKEKTYKIKSGDTLCKISKSQMGSSSKWKTLYNHNKDTIEKAAKKHGRKSSDTGHWIYRGTVLNIPS